MGFLDDINPIKTTKKAIKSTVNLVKNPSGNSLKSYGSATVTPGLQVGNWKGGEQIIQETSGDPTKEGSASDQMGNLLRAEWGDYLNRFSPYDQKLIGLATSDEDNQQAIARARANVGSSFDTSTATMQRNNERLGLSNYANRAQSLNRQTASSRTLAELNAVNKTRLHVQDRDKSIMSGDAAAGLKSGRLTES